MLKLTYESTKIDEEDDNDHTTIVNIIDLSKMLAAFETVLKPPYCAVKINIDDNELSISYDADEQINYKTQAELDEIKKEKRRIQNEKNTEQKRTKCKDCFFFTEDTYDFEDSLCHESYGGFNNAPCRSFKDKKRLKGQCADCIFLSKKGYSCTRTHFQYNCNYRITREDILAQCKGCRYLQNDGKLGCKHCDQNIQLNCEKYEEPIDVQLARKLANQVANNPDGLFSTTEPPEPKLERTELIQSKIPIVNIQELSRRIGNNVDMLKDSQEYDHKMGRNEPSDKTTNRIWFLKGLLKAAFPRIQCAEWDLSRGFSITDLIEGLN